MSLVRTSGSFDRVPADSVKIWEHFFVGSDTACCELLIDVDGSDVWIVPVPRFESRLNRVHDLQRAALLPAHNDTNDSISLGTRLLSILGSSQVVGNIHDDQWMQLYP